MDMYSKLMLLDVKEYFIILDHWFGLVTVQRSLEFTEKRHIGDYTKLNDVITLEFHPSSNIVEVSFHASDFPFVKIYINQPVLWTCNLSNEWKYVILIYLDPRVVWKFQKSLPLLAISAIFFCPSKVTHSIMRPSLLMLYVYLGLPRTFIFPKL